MARYTVRYERDEDGKWLATVKGVRGCHTQGASIGQARKRIREALALFVDDAGKVELVDDIQIPAELKRELAKLEKIRKVAEAEQAKAAALTRQIAKRLTAAVSIRDAGEILHVSGARVAQLVE